jgi:nitric oxide reductase subunit C
MTMAETQTQALWWASESFWRKMAIWVTAGSFVVLIFLTFDTVKQITAGGDSGRVKAYSVINNRIDYVFDEKRNFQVPVIGPEEPLFGKVLTEDEAEALVTKGKLTTQAKNCMGCHTLLGNGAYYAPDLTKSWLDQSWGSKEVREQSMVDFLMDPTDKLHNALGRRMPNLGITEEEARATVAFLKWMSAIDTNGFPTNFQPIDQADAAPEVAPEAAPAVEAASDAEAVAAPVQQ